MGEVALKLRILAGMLKNLESLSVDPKVTTVGMANDPFLMCTIFFVKMFPLPELCTLTGFVLAPGKRQGEHKLHV